MRSTVLATVLGFFYVATASAQTAAQWVTAREQMVDRDIVGAGIRSQRVIAAMRATPRHEFVPASERHFAYFDMALPIGEHQTISTPFIVAYMTERLDVRATDKVLEIGTGSGYQAAVLSPLAREVYTIEIVQSLGSAAADKLARLGYKNVKAKVGDGFQGWAEHAPFDRMIVTCSPERIPEPLVEQLREGGRMVIPLGERYQQTLYLMRKVQGKMVAEALEPTFFVPMNGTAEELRAVKPDSPVSALVNGNFEEGTLADHPLGWYYVRQGTVVSRPTAAGGGHCLLFQNSTSGRGSQALQALGVDGRDVPELEVAAMVRARGVKPGPLPEHLPKVLLTFFD